MKKLFALLASVALVLSLTACGEEKPTNPETPGSGKTHYTVYTSSGYAPYETINEQTKELEGFDIDLLEALSKEMNFEYTLVDVNFEGVISGIVSGKADFAIAGLSPTPDRLKNVDMSINYYDPSQGLEHVVISKEGLTENDLNGKVVGVQQGTIQQTLLETYKDELGYKIDPRTDYASIINEINIGRIDAIVVEKPVGMEICEKHTALQMNPFTKELGDANGNAIAFKKGSPLVAEFNKTIEKFLSDGTIDALVEKWFSVEEEVTTPSLKNGSYEASSKGFGGDLTVKVTILDGKISAVEVLSHSETAGISDKAINELPTDIVNANSYEVDTKQGCTVTSNAIIEAVKLCLEQAK